MSDWKNHLSGIKQDYSEKFLTKLLGVKVGKPDGGSYKLNGYEFVIEYKDVDNATVTMTKNIGDIKDKLRTQWNEYKLFRAIIEVNPASLEYKDMLEKHQVIIAQRMEQIEKSYTDILNRE